VNAILRVDVRVGDVIKFKIDFAFGMSYLDDEQAGGQ
jgi:hypothetical protein